MSASRKSDGPSNPERRRLVETTLRGAVGAGVAGALIGAYQRSAEAMPTQAIRPPGALPDERAFLAACVRCGLCVRACPWNTLKLADLGDHVASGTPYFIARKTPCEMCEDIPCVKACPTGALDHGLVDINKAKMGTAVLVDEENCLNFLGLRCDVCYRDCPVIDKALTLEMESNPRTRKHAIFRPTVHASDCTGCGKCEKSCVLEEAAIKVLPLKVARGELGRHYRLGWKEYEKHQGPLVDGIVDLPDRAPGDVTPPSGVPDTPPIIDPTKLGKGWKP
ncbi:ferredoxin-type protein NapG [Pinisolibacter aquiterrae]|uniref:ferredoxin-type protein NapG n=1 Tax=Pinisolibacter aquiterrae TaxID=2815579 RepID=UPI001C3E15E0|nr:ferredoxin-type protein NapG [Pinisolibacter aquiterrae]MBV5265754.1 ferredoxin-type protein NapG [Pinisolibacter aquiterrae]MCC8236681.1 ferredoxin-type protein NapG [Pinisolibacter aquiterrae]